MDKALALEYRRLVADFSIGLGALVVLHLLMVIKGVEPPLEALKSELTLPYLLLLSAISPALGAMLSVLSLMLVSPIVSIVEISLLRRLATCRYSRGYLLLGVSREFTLDGAWLRDGKAYLDRTQGARRIVLAGNGAARVQHLDALIVLLRTFALVVLPAAAIRFWPVVGCSLMLVIMAAYLQLYGSAYVVSEVARSDAMDGDQPRSG